MLESLPAEQHAASDCGRGPPARLGESKDGGFQNTGVGASVRSGGFKALWFWHQSSARMDVSCYGLRFA